MLPTPSPHASTRDFLPCPNCVEVGMLPIWVFISEFGVRMVSARWFGFGIELWGSAIVIGGLFCGILVFELALNLWSHLVPAGEEAIDKILVRHFSFGDLVVVDDDAWLMLCGTGMLPIWVFISEFGVRMVSARWFGFRIELWGSAIAIGGLFCGILVFELALNLWSHLIWVN
ncbi:hypothetical protein ZIOFF_069462 [Zingiber officinale]|uniref:Uncharacterized protein n=1 Tax=Zingiber officinale TaxID=94328 RepID=A0A8J5CBU8_ZINOF|nr:hypothetical protein ZIOFF_069462 [Zingiber officinale]